MALLDGCLILTTWPQEPNPSSPRFSKSWMLLKNFLPSTVMIPVNLMISWSLASISACLEWVPQLPLLLRPAKSNGFLTRVGVPFGWRGTATDNQKIVKRYYKYKHGTREKKTGHCPIPINSLNLSQTTKYMRHITLSLSSKQYLLKRQQLLLQIRLVNLNKLVNLTCILISP